MVHLSPDLATPFLDPFPWSGCIPLSSRARSHSTVQASRSHVRICRCRRHLSHLSPLSPRSLSISWPNPRAVPRQARKYSVILSLPLLCQRSPRAPSSRSSARSFFWQLSASGAISFALLGAVGFSVYSSIDDGSSPACLEPAWSVDAIAAVVAVAAAAVASAPGLLCFCKKDAVSLCRPSSSASISSSGRCRQALLWSLAFDPVAAPMQPGQPSVYPYFCSSVSFQRYAGRLSTGALGFWRIWQVLPWHLRLRRHTDWSFIQSWFVWLWSPRKFTQCRDHVTVLPLTCRQSLRCGNPLPYVSRVHHSHHVKPTKIASNVLYSFFIFFLPSAMAATFYPKGGGNLL